MPRGVRRVTGELTGELERISKELANLIDRVRQVEGVKNAIDAYVSKNGRTAKKPGPKPRLKLVPKNGRRKRRGRPRKKATAAATTSS